MGGDVVIKDEFVPTVLHISDLHRTSEPRLSNDELLAAIVSDVTRWELEGIPKPELIVVSGDLIQGAELDVPNPDTEVEAQYREVGDFLRLCLLFIHPPAHGSEVSPAARNTLDSARIPTASKLLICGLFQKGRVLAQDEVRQATRDNR